MTSSPPPPLDAVACSGLFLPFFSFTLSRPDTLFWCFFLAAPPAVVREGFLRPRGPALYLDLQPATVPIFQPLPQRLLFFRLG